jgi:hypothetical protein
MSGSLCNWKVDFMISNRNSLLSYLYPATRTVDEAVTKVFKWERTVAVNLPLIKISAREVCTICLAVLCGTEGRKEGRK